MAHPNPRLAISGLSSVPPTMPSHPTLPNGARCAELARTGMPSTGYLAVNPASTGSATAVT